MFGLFDNKKEAPRDVKEIRHELLQFIKDQLKGIESGEGGGIHSIQLYLAPGDEERHLYEAAVHLDNPDKFKGEIQRIADDYAIDLPGGWQLELSFENEVPQKCIRTEHLPVGLYIATRKQSLSSKRTNAQVKVLLGRAEQEVYVLTPEKRRYCIGRERHAKTPDGFLRENNIAFPADNNEEGNKYVSRQHAHIEWNAAEGSYYLYADEGGVPPRNKVKVQTITGEQIRLQTTQIGHRLNDGDQIVLGEGALLSFNYISETQS